MALPDQLADLERKVSVRFSAALAEIRQEMRRAVEAQAQRASSARRRPGQGHPGRGGPAPPGLRIWTRPARGRTTDSSSRRTCWK